MTLHRFYIDMPFNKCEEISLADSEIINQWKNVLRFQKGDSVVLFNSEMKEFHGTVELISKEKVVVSCEKIVEVESEVGTVVTLFVSMIKKDKIEWVLQKCTEIGVSHFVPVISARTEKTNLDLKRAERIVKEAVEQSGRVTLPTICEPISLSDALDQCQQNLDSKTFYLEQSGMSFDLAKVPEEKNVSFFIGPEGGWNEKEVEEFERRGVVGISLGKNVLRAETASVAVSSLLLLGR